jgi:hypothetical protein
MRGSHATVTVPAFSRHRHAKDDYINAQLPPAEQTSAPAGITPAAVL